METVQTALFCNDEPLPVRPSDGYIGGFADFSARKVAKERTDPRTKRTTVRRYWPNVETRLTVPAESPLRVYHYPSHASAQAKTGLREMKDISADPAVREYVVYFALLQSAAGALYASIKHNHKNYVLVGTMDTDGQFSEAGRIGVVSQTGKLYLVQRPYDAVFTADEDLPENLGRVVWYDPFSGMALLKIKQGEARLHFGNVVANGFVNMNQGDYVAYCGEPAIPASDARSKFQMEISTPAKVLPRKPTAEELDGVLGGLALLNLPKTPAPEYADYSVSGEGFQPTLADDAPSAEALAAVAKLLGLPLGV